MTDDIEMAIQLLDSGSRQNLDRVKLILDKILLKDPENIQAYVELARYQMQVGGGRKTSLRNAERLLDVALDKDDSFANAYILRGYVYSHLNRPREAERDFNKALEIGTRNLWLYTNWGEMYKRTGDKSKSLEKLNYAIDRKRDTSSNDVAKRYAFQLAEDILFEQQDIVNLERVKDKKAKQFKENSCYRAEWVEFKVYYSGNVEESDVDVLRGALSSCQRKEYVNQVLGDLFLLLWFESREDEEQAEEYFNQSIVMDLNWAGKIHRYASNEKMQEVLKLLEKKSVDINEKDKDGFTALAYTVASDDVKAVSFLLSIGADPNIIVHNNASIFINSLIYNSEQTILALLKSNKLQNLKSADEAKALDLAKRRKLHKVEKKLKELSGKNSV